MNKLLPVASNQKVNAYLKEIAVGCKIKKTLTFHLARHTFATTFLISGGKVEVLQKLLSHSRIDTTMIYVHITRDVERKQLQLLDYLKMYINENGHSPSYAEMAQDLNISSKSIISERLKSLEDRGHIRRKKSRRRSVTIV